MKITMDMILDKLDKSLLVLNSIMPLIKIMLKKFHSLVSQRSPENPEGHWQEKLLKAGVEQVAPL